jgi:CRISPR-associated protein Cmr4
MITHVYSIRALTNLHVGSGQTSYGIVDKLVQRDPTSGHPTVHMSGIKGAIRQYFRDELNDDDESIFGSAVKSKSDKVQPGKVRFISADLLAFPQPAKGTSGAPFQLVRCEKVAQAFDAKVALFTEWNDWAQKQLQGNNPPGQSEQFAELTRELPVVARNYLNNGISENLWYEEFVPREAIFATIIQGPDTEMTKLEQYLHDKIIQLGGNASVGYGYCLFTRINP